MGEMDFRVAALILYLNAKPLATGNQAAKAVGLCARNDMPGNCHWEGSNPMQSPSDGNTSPNLRKEALSRPVSQIATGSLLLDNRFQVALIIKMGLKLSFERVQFVPVFNLYHKFACFKAFQAPM